MRKPAHNLVLHLFLSQTVGMMSLIRQDNLYGTAISNFVEMMYLNQCYPTCHKSL